MKAFSSQFISTHDNSSQKYEIFVILHINLNTYNWWYYTYRRNYRSGCRNDNHHVNVL